MTQQGERVMASWGHLTFPAYPLVAGSLNATGGARELGTEWRKVWCQLEQRKEAAVVLWYV